MLTTRRLDRSEWATTLAGTPLGSVADQLLTEDAQVIAIEDDGKLVGCWSLVRMWHAEGLWVAPESRGKVAVARHLLQAMKATAGMMDAPVILTGSEDGDRMTERLLEHVGAERVPVTLYRWPILEEVS